MIFRGNRTLLSPYDCSVLVCLFPFSFLQEFPLLSEVASPPLGLACTCAISQCIIYIFFNITVCLFFKPEAENGEKEEILKHTQSTCGHGPSLNHKVVFYAHFISMKQGEGVWFWLLTFFFQTTLSHGFKKKKRKKNHYSAPRLTPHPLLPLIWPWHKLDFVMADWE